jgi:hypothetical protein
MFLEPCEGACFSRAENRCEYCRLAQAGHEATFHIDHVWPRAKDGPTVVDNLALACVSCSLRKGARTSAPDPFDDRIVEIFNPRRDIWSDHFAVRDDAVLVGTTPAGRATVQMLQLNRPIALAIRREELKRGRYP